MNRMRYIRAMETNWGEPILHATVNESDVSGRLVRCFADTKGNIVLASRCHLAIYSLNGHLIASTSLETELSGIDVPEGDPPTFTGGISFVKREFLAQGAVFAIGIGSEVALYRCVPGERLIEDESVDPWSVEEQGRLHRSGDHASGTCSMVKVIG